MKNPEEKKINKKLENQKVDTEKVQGGLKVNNPEFEVAKSGLQVDRAPNESTGTAKSKSSRTAGTFSETKKSVFKSRKS